MWVVLDKTQPCHFHSFLTGLAWTYFRFEIRFGKHGSVWMEPSIAIFTRFWRGWLWAIFRGFWNLFWQTWVVLDKTKPCHFLSFLTGLALRYFRWFWNLFWQTWVVLDKTQTCHFQLFLTGLAFRYVRLFWNLFWQTWLVLDKTQPCHFQLFLTGLALRYFVFSVVLKFVLANHVFWDKA